jgi:TPR repeat protein
MLKSIAQFAFVCLLCLPLLAQQPNPAALYEKGMNALSGSGNTRSEFDAARYLRESAEAGYVPAQTVYAFLLERGTGVTPSQSEALAWYKKAAAKNDPIALWVVGRMYLRGEGTAGDRQEAERWLQRSAASGNEFGEYLLGLAKEDLEYTEAPQWYRKAAMKGLIQAQRRLGMSYLNGRGVPVDKAEAYQWLLLASENGDQTVSSQLSGLEAELGSNQVEGIKSKVRALQTATSRTATAHGCTGWTGEFEDYPATPPAQTQRYCR